MLETKRTPARNLLKDATCSERKLVSMYTRPNRTVGVFFYFEYCFQIRVSSQVKVHILTCHVAHYLHFRHLTARFFNDERHWEFASLDIGLANHSNVCNSLDMQDQVLDLRRGDLNTYHILNCLCIEDQYLKPFYQIHLE